MKVKRLEIDASRELQTPIHLAMASKPLTPAALDAVDEQRLIDLPTSQRKQQWLRGRHALLILAQKLNLNTPLSELQPPCPGVSLTHNGHWSIAAGIDNGSGIGVDFEAWRKIDDAMLRWYLAPTEQEQLHLGSQFTRLRLWTIKESLYKANNLIGGFTLTDFVLDRVNAITGTATNSEKRFRYTSLILRQGLLSIAITNL